MPGSGSIEPGLLVRVVRKEMIAEGVVKLVLSDISGAELPAWTPGAHIDLLLEDGTCRQYSLCGDQNDLATYEIAVLRENESRGGSAYIHDVLEEGDSALVKGPRNNFALVGSQKYLFIAGGIGITPIMPMLEALGTSTEWRLLYGGRSRSSMAFRDELVTRYGDRVNIRPQDEFGMLDLDSELNGADSGTAVYCCGPEPLLEAVEHRCESCSNASLHVERFSPKVQDHAETTAFEVELARSGKTLLVPADRSIVDVLGDVGIDVDVSCEEGICGTCETAVLDGIPDHRDSVLTEEEKAENDAMMLCVSRSCSPQLRLDL
ncbi:oxidoreductase [Haloechinothrix sp. YIM 98757]|uniref:Oxidoreductase n=1 Tax=Haloechinothrix aidingensis TaxID=2752311 RepID=A0A838ABZ5_9PSEU|nr:PDR/VanB family oxidoreductase [Haloechinothrix aidingensis]MBA0126779.1 oxidoreductase [Haloechinothrix aidingensis]